MLSVWFPDSRSSSSKCVLQRQVITVKRRCDKEIGEVVLGLGWQEKESREKESREKGKGMGKLGSGKGRDREGGEGGGKREESVSTK